MGPQYPDADILYALALAMQGNGKAAVVAADSAVTKDPTDPEIANMALAIKARFGEITTPDDYERRSVSDSLTNAGLDLLVKGKTREAVDYFQSALKAWPENPDALLRRGMAGIVLNQQDGALKDLLQARKIYRRQGDKSRLAVAMAVSASARLGELEKQQMAGQLRVNSAVEELDKVADEATQAMELDPKLELAQYTYVQSRGFKVGALQSTRVEVQWDTVQAAADRFVKTRADSAMAWSAHATVNFLRNNPKAAAEDLSKAIEINGSSPMLYRQRGVAWHKASDFDKAGADYKKAILLAPADWHGVDATRKFLGLAQDKKSMP